MGVAGLTTYIGHRESLYFDEVLLNDCALIIDGNSLVPYLYNSSLVHTSAFGGDYDRLGQLTETFFKRLAFNKIYPIVVFDGAVEKRKVNTIKTRTKGKLMSLQNLTPQKYNCQCFPLLMRKAMREKLIDMGVVILQTDLEADSEIAALSKIFKVPVLSNDSDYYIFNVLYIPIPSLKFNHNTKSPIKCKVFRMDRFLQHLDLDVTLLPLLAVILGNDYIAKSEFKQFLGQIKLDKGHHCVASQKLVAGVLRWMKSESVETGLQKILSCMRSRGRAVLKQKMVKIMRGYTNLATELTSYLPDTSKIKSFPVHQSLDVQIGKLNVESDEESDVEESYTAGAATHGSGESSSEDVDYCSSGDGDLERTRVNEAEVEAILKEGQTESVPFPTELFPKWLMHKSRVGLVNPDILTLLNLRSYFSTPQPECYEMSFSGEPYLRVLQCIAGLLLGPTTIHCWYRQHRNQYEDTVVPTITETSSFGPFPRVEVMDKLSYRQRKTLLHEILGVEDKCLAGVPDSWKLHIISIGYWLRNDPNNELKPHHLHSVITMLTLMVIDSKIGFYRVRNFFVKKYGIAVGKISKSRERVKVKGFPVFPSITDAIKGVTNEDCILIFDSLLHSFQVDRETKISKQFSTTLIHAFARLQHCLNLTSMLNTVLGSPYPDVKINAFYNGTFLYNTAVIYKKKSNHITSCVDAFLANTPTLLGLHKIIYKTFQDMCPEMLEIKSRRKSRKPKTAPVPKVPKEILKFDSDSEPFYDKNNRFSVVFT